MTVGFSRSRQREARTPSGPHSFAAFSEPNTDKKRPRSKDELLDYFAQLFPALVIVLWRWVDSQAPGFRQDFVEYAMSAPGAGQPEADEQGPEPERGHTDQRRAGAAAAGGPRSEHDRQSTALDAAVVARSADVSCWPVRTTFYSKGEDKGVTAARAALQGQRMVLARSIAAQAGDAKPSKPSKQFLKQLVMCLDKKKKEESSAEPEPELRASSSEQQVRVVPTQHTPIV